MCGQVITEGNLVARKKGVLVANLSKAKLKKGEESKTPPQFATLIGCLFL